MLLTCFCLLIGGGYATQDGGKAPRIKLSDGNTIPHMGLGTFLGFDKNGQRRPQESEVTQAVEWAIDAGYRLIDTSPLYLNEEQIGVALERKMKEGLVKREHLFIVTKLPSNSHARHQVVPTLKESLKRLKLDYVDLYLVHWPMGFTDEYRDDGTDYVETWKGMEETKRMGLARSIGLSNFNVTQMERVLHNSAIKPAVLQVEVNVNLYQKEITEYCKAHDIVIMAYAPFGQLFSGGSGTRHDDPILTQIAMKYSKSPAQIVLKYLIQRGLVPIPKSTNQVRIQQNINIQDFELDSNEMKIIDSMNTDVRTVLPSFWQHHKDYPFEKVKDPIQSPF